MLWRRFGSFWAVDREGRLGPTSHAYGVAVVRSLARRNGDQLDQVEAIRFSTRITCTAVQSPAPRDVGMPCPLRPTAMARRVVFPAACSVAIVGPMSSVISVAVIVVHGLFEIIGGENDFYVVDVIWPFIVDPAHNKSVATAST